MYKKFGNLTLDATITIVKGRRPRAFFNYQKEDLKHAGSRISGDAVYISVICFVGLMFIFGFSGTSVAWAALGASFFVLVGLFSLYGELAKRGKLRCWAYFMPHLYANFPFPPIISKRLFGKHWVLRDSDTRNVHLLLGAMNSFEWSASGDWKQYKKLRFKYLGKKSVFNKGKYVLELEYTKAPKTGEFELLVW